MGRVVRLACGQASTDALGEACSQVACVASAKRRGEWGNYARLNKKGITGMDTRDFTLGVFKDSD